MKIKWHVRSLTDLLLVLGCTLSCSLAWAQTVKVTSLGSHAGELCARDRAMIFEDPTGVRILYDPGQSLTGGGDPRLGDVHAVLVSHAHGDHLGDVKMTALNAGTCQSPETVSAAPNSTTGEIVAAKNAAIVMISSIGGFVAKKVQTITGKPVANCANEITVPLAAPCVGTRNLGGKRAIKATGAAKAVEVTLVFASHASNVSRELLSDPERTNLAVDNMNFELGPPTGFVVAFTNGLKVYLSGDTGIHTEMKTVVHDFHKVNLAVLNLGDGALAPDPASYVINQLIRPAAVVVTHVNEWATTDGKVRPGTSTRQFIDKVKGRPVHVPLSGKTMEFNGAAKCVSGCGAG